MATRYKVLPLLVVCLPLVFSGCSGRANAATNPNAAKIERGRMLVIGGACHDCHTPKKFGPNGPEPDMSRMLSGHPADSPALAPHRPAPGSPWVVATTADLTAWSGPWGVSFPIDPT